MSRVHIHETLDALYHPVTVANDNRQIVVEIDKPGMGSSLGTSYIADMDSLEAIARRAEEYAVGSGRVKTQETIRVNGKAHEVSFYRYDNSVVVELYQKAPSGNEQAVVVGLNDLREVLHEGNMVEQELGCQKDHYVLFNAESLARNIHGQINAVVAKTVQGYNNALNALQSPHDALYEKPMRFPQPRGEAVLLDPTGEVRPYAQHQKLTAEEYDRQKAPFRERENKDRVIARWCESEPPKMGDRVSWTGNGVRYNGDFEDYFARHRDSTSRAPSTEPRWVLIDKGTGTILAHDTTKEPLVKQLGGIDLKQARQAGADWDLSQESFKRNR